MLWPKSQQIKTASSHRFKKNLLMWSLKTTGLSITITSRTALWNTVACYITSTFGTWPSCCQILVYAKTNEKKEKTGRKERGSWEDYWQTLQHPLMLIRGRHNKFPRTKQNL